MIGRETAGGKIATFKMLRVVPYTVAESLLSERVLAQAASKAQHVQEGDDGNRLEGCRCERKQRRRRSLVSRQRALKFNWLIDHVAASEMADRHNQPSVTVVVAKIELDGIRPSAAVPSFGMCPEPTPIKLSDLPKCAQHPAAAPLAEQPVCLTQKSPARRAIQAGHKRVPGREA
jgi:hypothetical protein